MAAKIIDGKQLAADLRAEIAAGTAELKATAGVTPGLAVILVGPMSPGAVGDQRAANPCLGFAEEPGAQVLSPRGRT